jgi:hypothetical protein
MDLIATKAAVERLLGKPDAAGSVAVRETRSAPGIMLVRACQGGMEVFFALHPGQTAALPPRELWQPVVGDSWPTSQHCWHQADGTADCWFQPDVSS